MFQTKRDSDFERVSEKESALKIIRENNYNFYLKTINTYEAKRMINGLQARLNIQDTDSEGLINPRCAVMSWKYGKFQNSMSTVFNFCESEKEFKRRILAFFGIKNELSQDETCGQRFWQK